jgi:hypothetical protein
MLPIDIVHEILFYYTNHFSGLLHFGSVCRDWKSASDRSLIWCRSNLSFYCPHQYYKIFVNCFSNVFEEGIPEEPLVVGEVSPTELIRSHFQKNEKFGSSWKFKVLIENPSKKHAQDTLRKAEEIRIWFMKVFHCQHQFWSWQVFYQPLYHQINQVVDESIPRGFLYLFVLCWFLLPTISYISILSSSSGQFQSVVHLLFAMFFLSLYLCTFTVHSVRAVMQRVLESKFPSYMISCDLKNWKWRRMRNTVIIIGIAIYLEYELLSRINQWKNFFPLSFVLLPVILYAGKHILSTIRLWKENRLQRINVILLFTNLQVNLPNHLSTQSAVNHFFSDAPIPLTFSQWMSLFMKPFSVCLSFLLLLLSIDFQFQNDFILSLYSFLPFILLLFTAFLRTVYSLRLGWKCYFVYQKDWMLQTIASVYVISNLIELSIGGYFLSLLLSVSSFPFSPTTVDDASQMKMLFRLSYTVLCFNYFLFFEFVFSYFEDTMEALGSL